MPKEAKFHKGQEVKVRGSKIKAVIIDVGEYTHAYGRNYNCMFPDGGHHWYNEEKIDAA